MTDSFTTEYGVDEYGVDSPNATVTVTLDPNGAKGDQVVIRDVGGNAAANPITVMDGVTELGIINQNNGSLTLTNYAGSGGTTWGQTSGGTAPGCSQPICQNGNAYGERVVIGATDNNHTVLVGSEISLIPSYGIEPATQGVYVLYTGTLISGVPAVAGEPVLNIQNANDTTTGPVNNAGVFITAGVSSSDDYNS
jgi:hypothetical protein